MKQNILGGSAGMSGIFQRSQNNTVERKKRRFKNPNS